MLQRWALERDSLTRFCKATHDFNRHVCTVSIGPKHRIRMEIEAKANSRRLFFGKNGGPMRLCSRQID